MERTNRQATKYRDSLNRAVNDANIAGIFSSAFTIGAGEGASEVYFNPFENYGVVGITIGGVPNDLAKYPISLHNSIISKFKVESGQMNINENNTQQEMRVSAITETYQEIELFVKIFPTAWGEELLMRIEQKAKREIQNA